MVAAPSHLHPLALLASDFTDPEHERLIYLAAGGLAVLGVVLLVATVLWWRGTKGEHAALAPLEVMGQRSWLRAPYMERVRRLEDVRVRSADDPDEVPVKRPEEIDLDDFLRTFQPGFDDLRDEPVTVAAAGQGGEAGARADAVAAGGSTRADVAGGEVAPGASGAVVGASAIAAHGDQGPGDDGEDDVVPPGVGPEVVEDEVVDDGAGRETVDDEVLDDDARHRAAPGAARQAAPGEPAAEAVSSEHEVAPVEDAVPDELVAARAIGDDVDDHDGDDVDDHDGVSVGRRSGRTVDPLLARGAGDVGA